jgi:hypothetical protein
MKAILTLILSIAINTAFGQILTAEDMLVAVQKKSLLSIKEQAEKLGYGTGDSLVYNDTWDKTSSRTYVKPGYRDKYKKTGEKDEYTTFIDPIGKQSCVSLETTDSTLAHTLCEQFRKLGFTTAYLGEWAGPAPVRMRGFTSYKYPGYLLFMDIDHEYKTGVIAYIQIEYFWD